jgi:hypothetical protein
VQPESVILSREDGEGSQDAQIPALAPGLRRVLRILNYYI